MGLTMKDPEAMAKEAADLFSHKKWYEAGLNYLQAADILKSQGSIQKAAEYRELAANAFKEGANGYNQKTQVELWKKCSDKYTYIIENVRNDIAEMGAFAGKTKFAGELDNVIKYGSRTDLAMFGNELGKVAREKKFWVWKLEGGSDLKKRMLNFAAELETLPQRPDLHPILEENERGALIAIMFDNPTNAPIQKIMTAAMSNSPSLEETIALLKTHVPTEKFRQISSLYLGLANAFLDEVEELGGIAALNANLKRDFRIYLANQFMEAEPLEKAKLAEFFTKKGQANADALADEVIKYFKDNQPSRDALLINAGFTKLAGSGAMLPGKTFSARQWESIKNEWKSGFRGQVKTVAVSALLMYGLYTLADWKVFEGKLPYTIVPVKPVPWSAVNVLPGQVKALEAEVNRNNDLLVSDKDKPNGLDNSPVVQWKYRVYLTDTAKTAAFEGILATPEKLREANFGNAKLMRYGDLDALLAEARAKVVKLASKTEKPSDAEYNSVINLMILAANVGSELIKRGEALKPSALLNNSDMRTKAFFLMDMKTLHKLAETTQSELKTPFRKSLEVLGAGEATEKAVKSKMAEPLKTLLNETNAELTKRTDAFYAGNQNIGKWLKENKVKDDASSRLKVATYFLGNTKEDLAQWNEDIGKLEDKKVNLGDGSEAGQRYRVWYGKLKDLQVFEETAKGENKKEVTPPKTGKKPPKRKGA